MVEWNDVSESVGRVCGRGTRAGGHAEFTWTTGVHGRRTLVTPCNAALPCAGARRRRSQVRPRRYAAGSGPAPAAAILRWRPFTQSPRRPRDSRTRRPPSASARAASPVASVVCTLCSVLDTGDVVTVPPDMDSTPICRCRVLYLGSAVPQQSKDGLQGVQEPLRELYPDKGAATQGIDSWLSVWSNGILLENVDESGERVARFFPISSLHYCAAVRRVTVEGAPRFLPLDSPFARAPSPRRPPLFAAVLRRTRGIKVLECHAFVCRREAAANALVRCCFHAYADSSYARRLDAERTPADAQAQDPDDDAADIDLYDGDENHKVWLGEVDQREQPEPAARAPRPRQIARPASVPPPPPPPEESRTNTRKTLNKKTKKKSSASADDVYATMPAAGMRTGGAARGWPGGAPPPPLLLMPHPAATLPHARGPHAARAVRPPHPGVAGRARLHYATVDPRRSVGVGGGTLKPAQSMSGLDAGAADEGGGIYRKKGHLNERAFSYSIRQEHRSRSHGSLANLKFSAPAPASPPEVSFLRADLPPRPSR
ncbi:hypothetical protein EVAR_85640_1 [Eumeta japonica]|uniref:PID domain-containing protein n=1 Tax=Eumeta variegata TaxID=151549 RepID=A0A4C1XTX3_EUMVA|nr:hypothetical protein EVAR_85640_1 [Eumeta japonica]